MLLLEPKQNCKLAAANKFEQWFGLKWWDEYLEKSDDRTKKGKREANKGQSGPF